MKKGVSILICSFNGAQRLPQTIRHLALQIVQSDLEWEIIVVDNASTDRTSEVARREWSKYHLPHVGFSVLTESRPGKINALAAGTSRCKYEYYIICDDDNWLCDSYVQTTYEVLESDPRIGAVGGQTFAVNDSGILPQWFEQYKEGYAVGKQGVHRGDVTSRGFLFGAGLGTRTRLHQEMYGRFRSLLVGRQGERLSAGEDTEYCQRLILRNYTLFYEPKLTLNHYLPEYRLQPNYRDRLYAGLEEADRILATYFLVNKLKKKLKGKLINKLRLLLISPFRILAARSANRLNEQSKLLLYLLNIKSSKDPNFDSIRKFERMKYF
jgi:glycosyltransferase involved in cell wall biosynthesis